MQKSVRFMGGGEMMAKEEHKFTIGDIIHKRKHHNTLIYLIVNVQERGEYEKYKYLLYSNEIFHHHKDSGWRRVDYFDRRVEEHGEESDWIDHEMGSFEYMGHISNAEPFISIGEDTYYTFDLEKYMQIQEGGVEKIKSHSLFFETVSTDRDVCVHDVGHKAEKLADDMLRLSYGDEDMEFVEHQKNVMEAIDRGIWIPIKKTEAKINGQRVTEI